ncbi:MAG: hypothetical protein QXL02_01850 [Candidatus Anstonellales archaeon]
MVNILVLLSILLLVGCLQNESKSTDTVEMQNTSAVKPISNNNIQTDSNLNDGQLMAFDQTADQSSRISPESMNDIDDNPELDNINETPEINFKNELDDNFVIDDNPGVDNVNETPEINFKNELDDNFVCHLIIEFENMGNRFTYDFKFYKSGSLYRVDLSYGGFKNPETGEDIYVYIINKYKPIAGSTDQYEISWTTRYMDMSYCNRTTMTIQNINNLQNPTRYIDIRDIQYRVIKQECQGLSYDPKIFEFDC